MWVGPGGVRSRRCCGGRSPSHLPGRAMEALDLAVGLGPLCGVSSGGG